MPRRCLVFAISSALWFLCACRVGADVEPLRTYTPRGQPVGVKACGSSALTAPIELRLIDPVNGATLNSVSVEEGLVDLGSVFPSLWTARPPRVLSVQAVVTGRPEGPPLIVEPLTQPRRATDGLSSALNDAIESGDRAKVLKLLAEPDSSRRVLRQTVKLAPDSPVDNQPFALRTYVDQRVVLETSAGQIELALHPEAAPRTCFHFLELVRGGFYNGTIFHRIVAADGRGRPFLVQGGDPVGTGAGGPGFAIDFEASSLPHDFGVVSMARQPNDPNSAGSQFFICLSREACAILDGQYTSFARVVRGADVLGALASSPVRSARSEGASGDRPIEPPVIRAARAEPAPPIGEVVPAPIPSSPELAPAPVDR